jgi:hypothetical protein
VVLLLFIVMRFAAAWHEQGAVLERQEILQERLEEARQRLAEMHEVTQENAQLTSAIQKLTKVTEPGSFITELLFLTRNPEVTPNEIQIREMVMRETPADEEARTQPASVLIRGVVKSQTGNEYDVVLQFRDRLLASDVVKFAEIDSSRTEVVRDEFKFEMVVKSGRSK